MVRPSFGSGFQSPRRGGNQLTLNIPSWADSGIGHTGSNKNAVDPNQQIKLYQGSTLIEDRKGQQIVVLAPQERTQYRLVNDVKRDAARWHTSVQTHTEWTFWSQYENKIENLPLLSLNYKVDTDMNGNARAGQKTELALSAFHVDNAKGVGNIEGASLQVSFDEGKTWESATLTPKGEGWVANISHPKKADSVSLKASAWDDAGNRIDQEIIKAYGLDN
ncbi:hypothetical protein V7075_15785 [Neobacillus drentensis]|uniref:hypothetical protein n=1 Tax=Neobacillus drentensis TaxID=220684 RepID=UPI002FFF6FAB